MSDSSSSPIIPARPAPSNRGSQSSGAIPVIPQRPRRAAKSESVGGVDQEAQINARENENHVENSDYAAKKEEENDVMGGSLETDSSTYKDGEGSADVLSELVSELSETPPSRRSSQIETEKETSTAPPSTNAENSTDSGIDPLNAEAKSREIEHETGATERQSSVGTSEPNSVETSAENADEKAEKYDANHVHPATFSDADVQISKESEVANSDPVVPSRPKKAKKKDPVPNTADASNSAEAISEQVSDKNLSHDDVPSSKEGPALAVVSQHSDEVEPSVLDEDVVPKVGDTEKISQSVEPESLVQQETSAPSESSDSVIPPPATASAEKIDVIPTESVSETGPESLERKTENDSELPIHPVVPKRPTRSETPKIPTRPTKAKSAGLTGDLESDSANSPEMQEPQESAKKAPPPKPKKLSSKIAAFQQMFNQAPLEHTAPKPASRERNKLSSNQTDFASNLQNMMGRGLPLPGMANPEMVKKLSAETPEEEAETSSEAPSSVGIARRARGPRGKRLPKQVQETKVEIEPRFQVSVSDLWQVRFTKSVSRETLEKQEESNIAVSETVSGDIPVVGESEFTETGDIDEKGDERKTGANSVGSEEEKQEEISEEIPESIPERAPEISVADGEGSISTKKTEIRSVYEDAKEDEIGHECSAQVSKDEEHSHKEEPEKDETKSEQGGESRSGPPSPHVEGGPGVLVEEAHNEVATDLGKLDPGEGEQPAVAEHTTHEFQL